MLRGGIGAVEVDGRTGALAAQKRLGANAFTIGSEISGDVRNVFITDCKAGEVHNNLLHIKSNTDRGGTVENVWARGITADRCRNCIQLETDYKGVADHAYPSQIPG